MWNFTKCSLLWANRRNFCQHYPSVRIRNCRHLGVTSCCTYKNRSTFFCTFIWTFFLIVGFKPRNCCVTLTFDFCGFFIGEHEVNLKRGESHILNNFVIWTEILGFWQFLLFFVNLLILALHVICCNLAIGTVSYFQKTVQREYVKTYFVYTGKKFSSWHTFYL